MKMNDTSIKFLYLDEEDMIKSGVLDAGRCVDTIEEVFSLLGKGDVLMGGRNHREHGIQLIFPRKSKIEGFPLEDSADRRFMAMPAYLGGRFHMAGEKYYGSNASNNAKGLPRSILMVTLSDVETGQPLAYMSGNLLSAMRTGAVPAVAARYCAKKHVTSLSLLGPGEINKACFLAFASQYPELKTVKIKGSSPNSKSAKAMREFIQKVRPDITDIIICKSLEESIRDVDIISEAVSVEYLKWPVIDPKWMSPGTTLISSGTIGFTDLEYVAEHCKKTVDNYGMYEDYIEVYQEYDEDGNRLPSGVPGMNFVNMVNDGRIPKSTVPELGKIINGDAAGRENDEDVYVVSVNGMPILDVGWGYECYHRALDQGIGTWLKLWDKPFMHLE